MIIWAILIIVLIIIVIFLQASWWKSTAPAQKKASGTFTIWIVDDAKTPFTQFLTSFKEANKWMSQVEYVVETFDNYETYSQSLSSAFIQWKAPDLFVLNNNETSLFATKTLTIPNEIININQFRKDYKTVFNTDLIVQTWVWEDDETVIEWLKWVPAWYETLGVFYNKRFKFKWPDFNSLAGMNSAISKVRELDVVPVALWNGSTIVDSGDILAQFFLLNKVRGIDDINATKEKQTLTEYARFGSIDWNNGYNELFDIAQNSNSDNIELFANKEVWAIVAYPRAVKQLEVLRTPNATVFATAFPHSFSGDGPSFLNYNYFVINKDSDQSDIWLAFMQYLNSDEWTRAYIEKFPYYLPPRVNLEDEFIEKKVSNYFDNIVIGDFYSDEPLSSFNKGNKVLYDKNIVPVLDDFASYLSGFEKFKAQTLCQSDKILNLTNLWTSCN